MIRHKSSQSGFTLVEAAIVVVIGGILLAAAAAMLTSYMQETRITVTKQRMQDIDNAIIQYLNVNGALPCVARMTDQQDSVNFGVEITSPSAGGPGLGTDCKPAVGGGGAWTTHAGIAIPPALGNPNTAIGDIIIGAVPVRTLNLPDQDIADAWGDRFTYAVTDALTIAYQVSEYDETQGAISVIDSGVNSIAPSGTPTPTATNPAAQYVLVSYGADRAGGYSLSGVPSGTPCPGAAALEYTNCAYATTTTFRQTLLNSNQTGTGEFDDYVIFHSLIASNGAVPKGSVYPIAGVLTCPPGWGNYGSPSTAPFGGPLCQACGNTVSGVTQPACLAGPSLPTQVACCQKL